MCFSTSTSAPPSHCGPLHLETGSATVLFLSDLPHTTVATGTASLSLTADSFTPLTVQIEWPVGQSTDLTLVFNNSSETLNFLSNGGVFDYSGPATFYLHHIAIEYQGLSLTSAPAECFSMRAWAPWMRLLDGKTPLAPELLPEDYKQPANTTVELPVCLTSTGQTFEVHNHSTASTYWYLKFIGVDAKLAACLCETPLCTTDSQLQFSLHDERPGTLYLQIRGTWSDKSTECLNLALELIHGYAITIAEQVCANTHRMNLAQATASNTVFALVDSVDHANVKKVLERLLEALMGLTEEAYATVKTGVALTLFGKNAPAPLEVKFLTLFTALEVLSREDALNDSIIQAMLSIEQSTASFIRVLRNKVTHGGGSFERAYPKTQPETRDLATIAKDLGIPITPHACDFGKLWMRLVERLDSLLWSTLVRDKNLKRKQSGLPPRRAPAAYSPLLR